MAMNVVLVITMLVVYLVILGGVLVLNGLGLWRMAKNAGISQAWSAFLYPTYIMALLAQRSLFTFTGKQRDLAKWSLWGLFASVGAGLLCTILIAVAALNDSGFMMVLMVLCSLVLSVVILAVTVLHCYCLYYVLKDYCPGNEVLLFVLSIFFGIVAPIVFLVQMNTVPVSVAGRTPYQQPKYNRV